MDEQQKNIKLLLSLGFEPISQDPSCTLFKKGTRLESVIGTTREALESKISKYMDITEKIPEAQVEEVDVTLDKRTETEQDQSASGMEDKFAKLEDSPFEDVEIESDQYTYLAEELKKIPLPILRRISYQNNRFYFEILESGDVVLYSSGTTLISDGYVSSGDSLNQWKLRQRILGNDPDAIARERADFGTIMHVLFGHLLLGKKIPFSVGGIKKYVTKIENMKIPEDRVKYIIDKHAVEMLEDLRSFLKWVKDFNVKPLAVELMLRSEQYEVASAIDLICQIDYTVKEKGFFGKTYQRKSRDHEKGDPMEEEREVTKQMIVIVDFKSNRDGNFYPEHALQLELYRQMVEENFGDLLNIEGLYNFAPKSWGDGKKPYHFLERSNDRELIKADCVFEQGRINHSFKKPMITCYIGVASIEEFEVDSCIKTIPLREYLSNPVNATK